MKKLFMYVIGLGLLSGSSWAACGGPFCYDDTGAAIKASVTVAGNETTLGATVNTPVGVTGISSVTVISPTASYLTIVSTGGPVTCGLITSNATGAAAPCISTATAVNGQYLVLSSTQGTSVVILSSGSASGLHLGASTRAMGSFSVITLIYDSALSMWKEISFVGS